MWTETEWFIYQLWKFGFRSDKGAWPPTFLYLSFSTLYSSSLRRTDTIIFSNLDKPPVSIKPPLKWPWNSLEPHGPLVSSTQWTLAAHSFFYLAKKAKTRNSNNVRDVFIANNNLRESMTAQDESSIVSFHFAILYHIQQPYDAWAACQISWPFLFFFFCARGGEAAREFQNVSSSSPMWAALQLLCQNSVRAYDPADYAGRRLWRNENS